MKVVPLSEAKTKLSHYGRLCQKEPIIVTVNGVASFELVPLDEDEDLIDQLIENHPGFKKLLRTRLSEKTMSAKDALRRM